MTASSAPSPDSSDSQPLLPGDRSPALASAVVLAAVFSVYGVHGPYFPVWLAARGLTKSEIAVVVGTPLVARLIVTPLIGRIADGRQDRRPLVAALLGIAAVAILLAGQASSFLAIFAASTVAMLCFQPVQPVVDATIGSLVRQRRVRDFGRIRLWGSLSFAVVAVLAGFLLNARGIEAVFLCYFGALVLAMLISFWLPSAGGAAQRTSLQPFRLWRRPALLVVLLSVSLINASQAMYYSFGSVHMLALEYPDWSIGLLWTVAVVAEIVVLWFAPTALSRLGPYRLLMIAALCSMLRWIGMGFDPPMLGTALLQTLHAGTLSCTYLALMAFIQRLVEEEATARAQSAAVTMTGFLTAGTIMLLGPVYDSLGGRAYFVAAVMAALAVVLLVFARRRLA